MFLNITVPHILPQFFQVTGILFWAVLAALFLIAAAVSASYDDSPLREGSGWWTFIVGVLGITTLLYMTELPTLNLSPGRVVGAMVAYLVIGGIWSVIRWRAALSHWLEQAVGRLASVRDERALKTFHEATPLASNNKSQLTFWIFYWPFSMVGNLTQDITRAVLASLDGVYNRISSSHQAKFDAKLADVKTRIVKAEAEDEERYVKS